MHREAAAFFAQQLNGTLEGRAAKAYLLDRGLDSEAVARFSIGFAPSGGEALLLRHETEISGEGAGSLRLIQPTIKAGAFTIASVAA